MIFNLFFGSNDFQFKKEINVIMYIIEIFLKVNSNHFHLNKISIRYEISKFMFF
jgi:hypothetical protein